MKCPNCGKALILNNPVAYNVEAYRNTVIAIAKCCGTGVNVQAKTSLVITPYTGDNKEDDWGNPIREVV